MLLCDLDQKLELLEAAGVDRTVVMPFDAERANETAEEFVSGILVEGLDARLVVVGEDFHFGHGRKGNVALLGEMGRPPGSWSTGCRSEADPGAPTGAGEPISSTRMRSLVAAGTGGGGGGPAGSSPPGPGRPVVHGDQRGGAELGFPTANVDVPAGICLPAAGIYAGWYERPDGSQWEAAVSVGRRPTFYGSDGDLLVEAHLLDFSGDLYGEEARVSFVARLRDELARSSRLRTLPAGLRGRGSARNQMWVGTMKRPGARARASASSSAPTLCPGGGRRRHRPPHRAWVGHADDGAVGHGRVLEEGGLDLHASRRSRRRG
jgi:FAD synthase